MTKSADVVALLQEADEYLAGEQHRPTLMIRKLRDALAAEAKTVEQERKEFALAFAILDHRHNLLSARVAREADRGGNA